jgi:hypothetical protein
MFVIVRLHLDVDADMVWNSLRSPGSMTALYAPLLTMTAADSDALPSRWDDGASAEVQLMVGGAVPGGRQRIDIRLRRRRGVRILEDHGAPTSGPLTVITSWRHRMAVESLGPGRTLYRDRLDISAGALTPLLWIGFWAMWRWRGVRMRRLLTA